MIEDNVTTWTEQLNDAMKYRRQFGLEDKWSELEAMLYGVHKTMMNAGPNIFLSTLDALASSLNVPYPYITVKARRQDAIQKSRMVERIDNMLVEKLCMQTTIERVIVSAFLWGTGIIKIGYDSEFGWDDTLDIGMANPHGPSPLGLTMSQFDKKGHRIEFGGVTAGMPWALPVLPHDFLVPWGTFSIKDAPWCAHRVVRHIDAIRGDTKYDRSVANKLQPNMSMEDFVKSYQSIIRPYQLGQHVDQLGGGEGDMEYVELWEIRDRATGRIRTMATGYEDGWLRNDPDSLQINGELPFVETSFVPKVRSFWVTPDAFFLKYHQADLSDIAVQTTWHRRLSVLKFFYDQGALDEQQLNNFLNGQIGAAIGIKPGMDITKVVSAFNAPTPNLQLYQDAQAVRTNAREQVGFSQNQIGEYESSGRRTAYEASQVAQAAGLRLDRRQNCIRYLYTDVFRIINEIMFRFWKMPRVVEVVGQDGTPVWQSVTGEDLDGDYDYDIGFSTGGTQTLAERRQSAMQLYAQLSQDSRMDPMKLAQFLANAMNDPEFSATFATGVLDGTAKLGPMQQQGGAGGQPGQGGGQAVPMGAGSMGPAGIPPGGG